MWGATRCSERRGFNFRGAFGGSRNILLTGTDHRTKKMNHAETIVNLCKKQSMYRFINTCSHRTAAVVAVAVAVVAAAGAAADEVVAHTAAAVVVVVVVVVAGSIDAQRDSGEAKRVWRHPPLGQMDSSTTTKDHPVETSMHSAHCCLGSRTTKLKEKEKCQQTLHGPPKSELETESQGVEL